MELLEKSFPERIKTFAYKVSQDDLFLFSSSVSYYSALALAPFMLILLWVASLIGQDGQQQVIEHAKENYSQYVVDTIERVFSNLNQGVNIGSLSGIIGFLILLWTCSLVFLQFRQAFDVIYGHHNQLEKSTWRTVRERFMAMLIVLLAALLFIISFTVANIVEYFVGPGTPGAVTYRFVVYLVNFLIYLGIFSLIHYLAPSRRPRLGNVVKIASLSSFFFLWGNFFLAYYLQRFAAGSIYGAAGTLLIFLVWAYYSAFTIFLSVEVFVYLKRTGRIKK